MVNKLDTVGWSQERFEEVVGKLGAFLKQAGFRESDVTFVPCSGLTGENLISPPSEDMLLQWYKGPCLLDVVGMLVWYCYNLFKLLEPSLYKTIYC